MPAFLTCDECGKDYLVPDEHLTGFFSPPDDDDEFSTTCPRCFDLCYRATDEEKQRREAYRQARTAE